MYFMMGKIERSCAHLQRENQIVVENYNMMYIIRSENIPYGVLVMRPKL